MTYNDKWSWASDLSNYIAWFGGNSKIRNILLKTTLIYMWRAIEHAYYAIWKIVFLDTQLYSWDNLNSRVDSVLSHMAAGMSFTVLYHTLVSPVRAER